MNQTTWPLPISLENTTRSNFQLKTAETGRCISEDQHLVFIYRLHIGLGYSLRIQRRNRQRVRGQVVEHWTYRPSTVIDDWYSYLDLAFMRTCRPTRVFGVLRKAYPLDPH